MYKVTIKYSVPKLSTFDKVGLSVWGVILIGLIILCGLT